MRVSDLFKDEDITDTDMFPVHTADSGATITGPDSPRSKATATIPLSLQPLASKKEPTADIFTPDKIDMPVDTSTVPTETPVISADPKETNKDQDKHETEQEAAPSATTQKTAAKSDSDVFSTEAISPQAQFAGLRLDSSVHLFPDGFPEISEPKPEEKFLTLRSHSHSTAKKKQSGGTLTRGLLAILKAPDSPGTGSSTLFSSPGFPKRKSIERTGSSLFPDIVSPTSTTANVAVNTTVTVSTSSPSSAPTQDTSSQTQDAKLPQTPDDARPKVIGGDQTDDSFLLSPEHREKDTKNTSFEFTSSTFEIVNVSNILRLAVKQYSEQTGILSDLKKNHDRKSINSLGELIRALKIENTQDQKVSDEEDRKFSFEDGFSLPIHIPGKLNLGILIAYVVGGVGGWNVHDGVNTSLKEIISEMLISHICVSVQKAFTAKNTLERFKLAIKEALLERLELHSYNRSKYPLVLSYLNALIQDLYRSAASVANKQGDYALVVLKHVANRIDGFLQFTIDGNKLSEIISAETMDDQTIIQKIAEQNDKMKDALMKKGLEKTYYKQIGEVEKLLDLTLDKDKTNKKYWIALYSMTKEGYGVKQSKTSQHLNAFLEKVPKIGHSIFAEKTENPNPEPILPASKALEQAL